MPRQKTGALFAVLALSNIAAALLFLPQAAMATNTIATTGDIAVKNDDESPFTNYDFPLFTSGTAENQLRTFYIENTGENHVSVEWSIAASTIQWDNDGKKYCHNENSIEKYTLAIQRKPHSYFKPEKQQLHLNPQEKTALTLELTYTGKPNTPETFTLTITFTATTHAGNK